MAPKTKRTPGKPRAIETAKVWAWCAMSGIGGPVIRADMVAGDAAKARRLAAFLLQAADWADAQAARRKGGSK